MFVRELGSGPAVLLLHGTPSPAADWLPVAKALEDRYRVLVPDLPGYGQSPPPVPASVDHVGDLIIEMLAEHGLTSLRAIAGFSSGAYRALHLVLKKRVQADALVLLAGFATMDEEGRAMRRGFAEQLRADPASFHSPELRGVMPQLMLSPAWAAAHPDDAARVTAWLDLTNASALADELDALASADDLRPDLSSLAPRLYLRVGAADAGAPPAWSKEISDRVPHATLDVVEGKGHSLLVEDLPATTAAILAAVDRGA